jgi:3-oxoacyl-[acyl-carrier-protein] synthase III
MFAAVQAIEYHLPVGTLSNEDLAREHPSWSVDRIAAKTGIRNRHVAAEGECSSDLAAAAARKLFASGACRPDDVDYLLLCTQSPDHLLPTTACILQDRLGVPTTAGALDFNLGCSGFVYGLSLARGLIETDQARNVLLLTAETYTKFLRPDDRGVRCLFGDGAAATLVQGRRDGPGGRLRWLGPFVFGTDGSGKDNLIVPAGGTRGRAGCPAADAFPEHLTMNGPEIFTFTLRTVPLAVDQLLTRAGRTRDEIDLFVFHQANRYMLDHLRERLGIPEEKFVIELRDCGNTVSSTIPIALKRAADCGRLRSGALVMLVGFGVGYSWCATLVRWAT